MASMVTSRASLGSGSSEFSSIMLRQQRLVERSPVHADAHRLLVLDRNLDHGAEIVVVFASDADVAGVDAVLGQRAGALGIFLEQDVAVVVEVADDRNAHALLIELLDDGRDRSRGFFVVDRDPHQLGPGLASAATCLTVEGMSAVSVLVIDCTTTGASLPTFTPPIEPVTDFLR